MSLNFLIIRMLVSRADLIVAAEANPQAIDSINRIKKKKKRKKREKTKDSWEDSLIGNRLDVVRESRN